MTYFGDGWTFTRVCHLSVYMPLMLMLSTVVFVAWYFCIMYSC